MDETLADINDEKIKEEEGDSQADTKNLTSSSKFSGSCVLT